jgi:hypothetical protein
MLEDTGNGSLSLTLPPTHHWPEHLFPLDCPMTQPQQPPVSFTEGRADVGARELADTPELAAFCGLLDRFVATGEERDGLRVAARRLADAATRRGASVESVLNAIHLIRCAPLLHAGQELGDEHHRHATGIAMLVRAFQARD